MSVGTYRYPQLWRGCVGAWSANRQRFPSVSMRDYSRKNNHATLVNVDIADSMVPYNGKQAFKINGTDDRADCGSKFSFVTASSFSAAGWINTEFLSSGSIFNTLIAQRASAATFEWALRVGTGSVVSFLPTTGGSVNGSTAISTGTWYHFAATCINGTVTVYYNGNAEASAGTKTISLSGSVGLTLGGWGDSDPNGACRGYLDDLCVHEPALDSASIKLLATRRGVMHERIRTRHRVASLAAPPSTNSSNLLLLGVG